MGKHIADGPLAPARGNVQSSSRQTCGKGGDGLWLLLELRQDLVDREGSVVHGDACCMERSTVTILFVLAESAHQVS